MSKKDALILGGLVIGGLGVASMISDTPGGGGASEGRAGGILGAQKGYGAPTIYNLPAQPSVTFPEAPTFDIASLFGQKEVSKGAAGVSAAPKKWRDTGTVALGYKGYVTPITPTPVSPGYVAGVTTFKKYEKPVYIPSPVKPPSVSYGGGGGGGSRTIRGKKYTSVSGKYSGR